MLLKSPGIKYIIYGFLIFIVAVFIMKTTLNAKSSEIPQKGGSAISNNEKLDKSGLSILFLGDSYTVGTGIDPQKSWPSQLQEKLVSSGYSINTTKTIAGNGWSSAELINQFFHFQSKEVFDIATIQIGVNDQFRSRDKNSYKLDFERLVELTVKLVGNDPSKVIVISIPDYGCTPSGKRMDAGKISKEVDGFNNINMTIAKEKGLKYIDITALSRQSCSDFGLVAPDGLHFSSKMYSKWVDLILPLFTERL